MLNTIIPFYTYILNLISAKFGTVKVEAFRTYRPSGSQREDVMKKNKLFMISKSYFEFETISNM